MIIEYKHSQTKALNLQWSRIFPRQYQIYFSLLQIHPVKIEFTYPGEIDNYLDIDFIKSF